ncbi:unnamed protein product [Rotaria socialis]|uniref:RNA helicase n=3 Tax=Rotaria socialis TaxID=392032 RepID=A0A820SRU9_9BILA|nr:unnamed protein product [Rotaria socialis]CAF3435231.1 unnamed protein product [Rotaria socialis]CAF3450457.1 unnamed protein product [Rotaria socialis]CAF3669205.1 unnamed protein product [Rotaria socialis]CAF3744501.1 unnamed protein product [Rotaria socialis]
MSLNYDAVPFEMNPYQTYINSNYGNGFFQQQYNDGIILTTPKPDWNQMILSNFQKNFYIESPLVQNRSVTDIQQFLTKNQITIDGNAPRPLLNFDEANFPEPVMETIFQSGFQKPTLIQSCSWPILLSGLDLIGIALTGSGKTLAFILPAIIHASHQEFVRPGEGPIVLIMAPTRELVQQIYSVANQFGKLAQCRTTVIFGGAPKESQRNALLSGVEVVIGTPGRLLDFIQEGALKLDRITFLVLDEADRMLDMGFEPQIRQICERIRSDRQTTMFSATWPKEVRKLADSFLSTNRVHVTIGNVILAANPSICQIIEVCTESQKQNRFIEILQQIMSLHNGKTLVFCQTKRRVNELYLVTKQMGFPVLYIHGDKQQSQRDFTMNEFRRRQKIILIATDVAARGIDIQDIQFVINIDFPNQTEDYIHRIGRTGRNTEAFGTSYTFFTSDNAKQAPSLVRVLQEAGQNVNQDLMEMAQDQSSTANFKHGSKNRPCLNQQRMPFQPSTNNINSYPVHQPVEYIPSMPQQLSYITPLMYNPF